MFEKEKLKTMRDTGESIKDILLYWLPEVISTTIFFSLPPLWDSYLVSNLGSTTTYGALAMANNFINSIIKMAEAIPVAAIAIIGRHNGAKNYERCGKDLGDTFWTTAFIGTLLFSLIFFGASAIFNWLQVPKEMIVLGTPYLRLKALGLLLTFTSLGFFGFLRGVKNTKTPMTIFIIGIIAFIFFDYTLVLGKFGFSKMGLMGSAYSTIIQYLIMNTISVIYILSKQDYKKYFARLFFFSFSIKGALNLLKLSWPIIIDKSSLALSYVWLSKMIAPMGVCAITSYDVIKNLERFAIIPAAAFASVITFLVSNRIGAKDIVGAKSNIKKVMIMTGIMVITSIVILCTFSKYFVSHFDPKHQITDFAAPALILVSILVIFDFVQMILAGALRGAGDVKTVMWARFICCSIFFVPISYLFSQLPIQNQVIKFALIYGTFYVTTGIVGIIFLLRIKTTKWQSKEI